jgi:hypothetical protein
VCLCRSVGGCARGTSWRIVGPRCCARFLARRDAFSAAALDYSSADRAGPHGDCCLRIGRTEIVRALLWLQQLLDPPLPGLGFSLHDVSRCRPEDMRRLRRDSSTLLALPAPRRCRPRLELRGRALLPPVPDGYARISCASCRHIGRAMRNAANPLQRTPSDTTSRGATL